MNLPPHPIVNPDIFKDFNNCSKIHTTYFIIYLECAKKLSCVIKAFSKRKCIDFQKFQKKGVEKAGYLLSGFSIGDILQSENHVHVMCSLLCYSY